MPVDSMTTSTPTSPQADAAGSFTARGADRPAVDHQEPILHRHVVAEAAVDRVVPEQVREVGQLEQVVHRDHLHVGALHRRAERHPADAPESVDADP